MSKYVLPKEPGVYACVHIPSGAKYIGSSCYSMREREERHWRELKKGEHYASRWQALYNEMGRDSFRFEVLERALPVDVRDLEDQHIKEFVLSNGRNALLNGSEHVCGQDSCTDEAKRLISEAQKKLHSDPVYAAAHRERILKAYEDPVYYETQAQNLRDRNADPEVLTATLERLRIMNADPVFAEANAKRLRDLHADPVFAAAHLERLRILHSNPETAIAAAKRLKDMHADPVFAAENAERLRLLNENPLFIEARDARLREMHADPVFAAAHAERMRKLNENPEFVAANAERLRLMNLDEAVKERAKAGRLAAWADPVKKAARLLKKAETTARNKAAKAAALLEAK